MESIDWYYVIFKSLNVAERMPVIIAKMKMLDSYI